MKENQIRPKDIFEEYLRLAKIDTKTYFNNILKENINCPACDSLGRHSFTKDDFDYCLCDKCFTLYVSPRPHPEAFLNFYTHSRSTKFWATTFYKQTEDARREKIWKPKAKLILDTLRNQSALDCAIVDIGGGYGIFAEEMQKIHHQPVTIIEPGPPLAEECKRKGLKVVTKFLEDVQKSELPNDRKCFVSFELFEHLHSPKLFINQLYNLMNPNDLFVFTTLSSCGLDIQVLWEKSQSVSPPHHLNFFNPSSVKVFLENLGFLCIDITTPGKLDIDILANNKNNIKNRFWKTFIETTNEVQREMWQNTIRQSGMSSHMMIVCKKQ